ncbi:hypothetical protein FSP39_002994 [Pinctada imbricata]|uniref:THAP-type domain-containing protein n=1 Tax=Pinctada imbricata TaxID=66713 RepID=A0AA89C9R9_PINIB|nr:hypothetical protein FSP39_002994 [Pinctada imbricata]
MPSCQALNCTNERGKCQKSFFRIPNPNKNAEQKRLCKQWITNLKNGKLSFDTFKYGDSKIVCEDHFTADCFERNVVAESLNFHPKRKRFIPNAVPTIVNTDKVSDRIKTAPAKRSSDQQVKRERAKNRSIVTLHCTPLLMSPKVQLECAIMSEEEENGDEGPSEESCHFARLSMLAFDVGQDSMRKVLRHISKKDEIEFSKEIQKYNLKLLDHEKAVLIPKVQYEKLDFSVMYKVCRNVLQSDIRNFDNSKAKWGKEPDDSDESLLATIERIRSVRNSAIGHVASTKLPKVDFEPLWNRMMKAIEIIDKLFNLKNKEEGIKLLTQPIDSALVKDLKEKYEKEVKILEEILEVSGQYDEEVQNQAYNLSQTIKKKQEHIRILKGDQQPERWEDFVRLNHSADMIQNMTNTFFKRHLKEDEFIVETKCLEDAKTILKKFNHVTIKGFPGTGKTKLAIRLVLNFVRSHPRMFYVRKLCTPDHLQTVTPEENQIIFIDDIFGKGLAESREVRNWAETFKFFIQSESRTGKGDTPSGIFFIVTSGTHPFDSAYKISRTHPFLQKGVVVDLSPMEPIEPSGKKSPTCSLQTHERKEIVIQQFKLLRKEVPENVWNNLHIIADSFTVGPQGFPLCAKLFASEDRFTKLCHEFFSKPHHHLLDLIHKAVEDADVNRIVLLSLLFHENEKKKSSEAADTKMLCFQDNEKYCKQLIARNNLQDLLVSENEPIDIIDCEKAAAENMENLISKGSKGYAFLHDSVHEAVEIFFMQTFFNQAVESVDIDVLVERVEVEGSIPNINLKSENYSLFAKRLIAEIEKGNAKSVCKSPVMKHPDFLKEFSDRLRKSCQDDNHRIALENLENIFLFANKEDQRYNKENLLSFALKQKAMDLAICLLELMREFKQKGTGQHGSKQNKSETQTEREKEREKIVQNRLSCALIKACSISYANISVFQQIFTLFKEIFTLFTESFHVNCSYCEFCRGRNLQDEITPMKSKHHCCLEGASLVGNDVAVQTLLKQKAYIPHSRWNGWKFLHTCAEHSDEQLCNHKFIDALQKYHTSSRGNQEGVIVRRKENDLCEIADLIHHRCQPSNFEDLLDLLLAILTELELTPEILKVFEAYNIFIGESFNHKYMVSGLEGVDSCSSKSKIPHTHTRPFNRENSSDSASEIAIVNESGNRVYVYCLLHAVAKAKFSERFLLRRDLSLSEVESLQDDQSNSVPEGSSAEDYTSTPPSSYVLYRRRKEGLHEYMERRERMIKVKEMRHLVKHGCHIDDENVNGETVLTLEVMKEEIDLLFLKEILELDANPNVKDKGGCVPLHYIVSSKLEDSEAREAVRILVSKGADVAIKNNKGDTPLSLAIDFIARQTKPRLQVLQELLKSLREPYIMSLKSGSKTIMPLHYVLEIPFDVKDKIEVLSILKENLFELGSEKDNFNRTGLMTCIIHDPHLVDVFEFLLSWPLDITVKDNSDCTVLHHIVQADCGIENKMELLEKMGDDVKRIVNVKNRSGLSAIMIVLRQDTIHLQLVERLLNCGSDLSLQDMGGLDCFAQTLHYSLRAGKIFSERIYQSTMNSLTVESESMSSLHENGTVQWADIPMPSVRSDKKLLDMMGKYVKDFNGLDNKKRSCLHHLMGTCLTEKDAIEWCNIFIQESLDVDQEDQDGKSPVILALESCPQRSELLKCIISASKKARSWPQRKVYEMLVRPGCLSMPLVQYLVEEGILIEDKTSDLNTDSNLFHYLAETGFESFRLVKQQKNIVKELTGELGFNVLKYEEDKNIMVGLQKYFNINKRDGNSNTPLHLACKDAPLTCIFNFVDSGAFIDSRTTEDKIPAQIVIESDRSDSDVRRILQKHLLKDSNCVNHKDESDKTPLALAVSCKKDRSETIKFLLENGADVTLRDNCNATALHLSVGNEDKNDFDCQHYLQMLLSQNSDVQIVNAKNTSGMTPLNIAASICNQSRLLSMLTLLRVNKCNVDTTDELKRTPLLNCIVNMKTLGFKPLVDLERLARVCILLACGAKNTKDSEQMSVTNFCSMNPHHEDIRKLILGKTKADKSQMQSLLQKSISNVRTKSRMTGHELPDVDLSSLGAPLCKALKEAAGFLCDDELAMTVDYHEYDENTTSDACV